MSNKQKGDEYERYILDILSSKKHKAWLWIDIPHIELRNAGLLGNWNEYRQKKKCNKENNLPDLGCDILSFDGTEYTLVQCKNYNNNKSVRQEDLAGIVKSIVLVFLYDHISTIPVLFKLI
jgi:hypothetical protein